MKTIRIIVFAFISIICLQSFAQKPQKETFRVWGNCEMCKKKIEKAANAVGGVKRAIWNIENDQMTVKFNTNKTSIDSIQKAIANVGYDTEKYKADDKVYSQLDGCCQYDREEK